MSAIYIVAAIKGTRARQPALLAEAIRQRHCSSSLSGGVRLHGGLLNVAGVAVLLNCVGRRERVLLGLATVGSTLLSRLLVQCRRGKRLRAVGLGTVTLVGRTRLGTPITLLTAVVAVVARVTMVQ